MTLRVWDLASGRAVVTLVGHAHRVTACAVTPDGRHAVSVSRDETRRLWDLDGGDCLLTHDSMSELSAVAATTDAIIVGTSSGDLWFFDGPSALRLESGADRHPDVAGSAPRGGAG